MNDTPHEIAQLFEHHNGTFGRMGILARAYLESECHVGELRSALAAMRSMALSGEPYSQQMRDAVEEALR